ncbi:cation:proton antiporter [Azospirillum sp. SYSU D00513]|uniref:cation:proton antiporter domain-containing protein n=1 Tax=Azospirillum sp. SYSU D00513 TaxID=2812561 RepID=UPI001A979969|nr:cation:proton antiporter [Azospirillum sp. SYSU D00513]
MTTLQFAALLLAVIGPLMVLARLLRLPDTLALFGAGAASAFLPGLPPVKVDPQLILELFLPPVIYASTVRVSYHLLRFTLLPGVLLGALLTLATAAAASVVAWLLLPELPWTSAVLLGILVSLFDTRLFHEAKGRPKVPRAVADTLKAREMVTRVLLVTGFGLAVGVLTEGEASMPALFGGFAYDLLGGIMAGFALGRAMVWLRERVHPAPLEIAVSVATPYLGALLAKAAGLQGVVVIMTAALVISAVRIDRRTGAPHSSSEARITAMAFWEQASLMLSAVLFFLAGRAMPGAVRDLGDWALPAAALAAAGLLLLVLVIQYAVGYATAALPQVATALSGTTRAAAAAIIAWASTRSVVGLMLALSIPTDAAGGQPYADRNLILVVVALVIVGSVVVQGLTLRPAVRRAALSDHREEDEEERLAERTMAEARGREAAGGEGEAANGFDAERRALLALREEDRIGDELLRSLLREVDLRSRVEEKGSLPGAGPPSP